MIFKLFSDFNYNYIKYIKNNASTLPLIIQNIHFVQLVTTPYIEKSINNTKNWVLSLSKAFYAVFALFDADPAFRDQALREGYSKYCDDLKYAPFRREIENLKGKEFF